MGSMTAASIYPAHSGIPMPAPNEDLFALLASRNLDDYLHIRELTRGVVRIADSITAHEVGRHLALLDEIMERGLREVHLHLTSSGGDPYATLALHDAMRRLSATGVRLIGFSMVSLRVQPAW
jgi:hypothetical protein